MRSLLRAGLGLPEAFAALAGTGKGAESERLCATLRLIDGGATLAVALRESGIVDAVSGELLVAAEESGTMDRALALLIEQEERFQRIRRDTILPALYPALLLVAVAFVSPLFAIPARIASGMAASGMPLAYAVGLLVNLALIVIGGLVVCGAPLLAAAANAESRFEAVLDRLPIVGRARRDLVAARFLATLGNTLAAGMDVGRCLALALRAGGRRSLLTADGRVVDRIRQGGTLADAVAPLGVLDDLSLRSLRIGELTGELEVVCRHLADQALERASGSARVVASTAIYIAYAAVLAVIALRILSFVSGPYWPSSSRFMDGL
jgi:type IV pilus assembly protein PilC